MATGVDGSSPIVVESFEGVSNGNQLHRRNVQSTVRPGLIPHLKFHMRIASEERVVSKVAPCTSGCDPGIPRADVTNATKRPTYIPTPLLFYLFTTQVVLKCCCHVVLFESQQVPCILRARTCPNMFECMVMFAARHVQCSDALPPNRTRFSVQRSDNSAGTEWRHHHHFLFAPLETAF